MMIFDVNIFFTRKFCKISAEAADLSENELRVIVSLKYVNKNIIVNSRKHPTFLHKRHFVVINMNTSSFTIPLRLFVTAL